MRVEQRIGRIDRYGQRSEKVLIYNFVTPGTVDFDIYDRCLLRIGIFRQALGGSEEILGMIAKGIQSIAENITLTPQEQQERLQQLADNEIRLQQEQGHLEARQAEFFGLSLPPAQAAADLAEVSSPWLGATALETLVQAYMEDVAGKGQNILGETSLKTLRAGQEVRARLLADYDLLGRRTTAVWREWEQWLKGSDPNISITFDDACAADNCTVMFITPIHPLAQQAARTLVSDAPLYTTFRVQDQTFPSGTHPFAIYQWDMRGVRPDVRLHPVCVRPDVAASFLTMLRKAQPADGTNILPSQEVFDSLDALHHAQWAQARSAYQDETRRLAAYRGESLRTSHAARVAILREQIARATDERIQRMRTAELGTAEADYARHLQTIAAAAQSAEIIARPVAFGVVIVVNEED